MSAPGPSQPDGKRSNSYIKPGDRRAARWRLLAVADAVLAVVVLVAWIAAQWQPDNMPGLAALLPALAPTTTATPRPVPTATPSPTPILTPTPVPTLPNASASGDFPTYLGYEGSGYNPAETLISAATAPDLTLFWAQHGSSVISTQPTVANGLIYWGDWHGNEWATTLAGKTAWSTNLGRTYPGVLDPCGYTYGPNPGVTSTASVATINGRSMVFVGSGDAQLYALDALSGATLWHTQLGSTPEHFTWSSPTVFNGSVYVGLASFSDCPLVGGQVFRLDAASGGIGNTFDVVPDGCTGGTVWGSPIVDPEEGAVYFATGGQGVCDSDEVHTSSVIKVRASDLSLLAQWRVPAGLRTEDGDFGNTPTLFSYTSRGISYPLVGVTHKNGQFYAFDRNNLGRGPVWQHNVSVAGTIGIYSPGAFDGTRVYVTGTYTVIGGAYCSSAIRALDPRTGADIWARCLQEGYVFGAVTASPGVVVVGAGPWIVVMSSETGETLFRYRDPGGNKFYAAASISHGLLLQGNTDGTLLAFGFRPSHAK